MQTQVKIQVKKVNKVNKERKKTNKDLKEVKEVKEEIAQLTIESKQFKTRMIFCKCNNKEFFFQNVI